MPTVGVVVWFGFFACYLKDTDLIGSKQGKSEKNFTSDAEDSWSALLGERIRQLRNRAGLNQSQLAERIGAGSYDVISRLEKGIAKAITLSHLAGLVAFAQEMGASADWLLSGLDPVARAGKQQLIEALARYILVEHYSDQGETSLPASPAKPQQGQGSLSEPTARKSRPAKSPTRRVDRRGGKGRRARREADPGEAH